MSEVADCHSERSEESQRFGGFEILRCAQDDVPAGFETTPAKNRCRLLVTLTLLIAATYTPSAQAAPPNVILCMADDLGWGDVGFNGNTVIQTPHLDKMAAAGLKFNRFYAGAPVCSPTRGSALTGRHPHRYGIFFANTGHMRAEEFTLAEALKAKGYATGHFGKWHLGTLTKTIRESNRGGPKNVKHFAPPWINGFDECFSTEAKVPTWDPLLRPKSEKSRTWWDPVVDASDAGPYGTNYWQNGERVTDELRGDDSRIIMDRAIPFVRRAAKQEQPFVAVIWFHAPHLPVVAGPEYTRRYSQYEKYAQHYYGCITALDEQMGRLRRELKSLGVADNTMLWFCSDNGPEGQAGKAPGSAGPLRGRKRSLYEGGVRVPGVLDWPAKVKPGSVTDVPASTSDYFPTVLAAAGFEPPERVTPIDGVNLLPVIEQRVKERPRPIGFQSRNQQTLTDNRYKLVRQIGQKTSKKKADSGANVVVELFDLIDDPSESTDVSDRYPEIARRMSHQLDEFIDSCAASVEGRDYERETD